MERRHVWGVFSLVYIHLLFTSSFAQLQGFVSIDCGGTNTYTDEFGLVWTPDNYFVYGETSKIFVTNETREQYTTLRYFPANNRKYCYTLNVTSRTRYLVRATFLYGNFDNNNVFPQFDISLGATYWSTIVISDANNIEVVEIIFLASQSTVSVCLFNATTGHPFISTLEIRQFNGSVYYTPFEESFYLGVSARINFGAESILPIRYPDDPFDRIWESDLLQKANYLVDVAAGTNRVSTQMAIDTNSEERPPQKVMQTAVFGSKGVLTYRLNLDGFPGFGWAVTYFAEIEDLPPGESRKFQLELPEHPELSIPIVNIEENARGAYRVYEPGFTNLSLPFVLSFKFGETPDSSMGPLLNAMEISKYLEKAYGSIDAQAMYDLVSRYPSAYWAQEGGDPCLPVPWSWLQCSSDSQPSVKLVDLSSKNLTGIIPRELTKLRDLTELWLNGNSLTGRLPDFTGCNNLQIIHLENNQLTGELPLSLTNLPKLRELYVQNNKLSGVVPSGLIDKTLVLDYSGNINLVAKSNRRKQVGMITGISIGASFLLLASVVCCICVQKRNIKHRCQDESHHSLPVQRPVATLSDASAEAAHCFSLREIKDATKMFEKKIGAGGFGVVYYGKMTEGKEIAVKVLTSNTYQEKREFKNEVTLLSRIHHRNLVQFLGYCQEEGRNMLVYDFMHNGTLGEHLHAPLSEGGIDWIKRLEIAEDAAKGIEYLHTGCIPAIIHRDLKTSNILLDKYMKAKVSDFGLSKSIVDDSSHLSSTVQGTVGYLDPEYYVSQQLTDKSDVYSFGVVLLELISGQKAISCESFGVNCRNIVQWAKSHVQRGNIEGIIDPALENKYAIESMWKIAEVALTCVQPHGESRPSITEVLKEIQDTVRMEKKAIEVRDGWPLRNSCSPSTECGLLDVDQNLLADETIVVPGPR